jgi:hypothetical protein
MYRLRLSTALGVLCAALCVEISHGMDAENPLNPPDDESKRPRTQQQTERKPFTGKENDQLVRLVDELSTENWLQISKHFPGKTARQCREQYINYLQGGTQNPDWDPDEDAVLVSKYKEIGPRWGTIADSLPGRLPIFIKHRLKILQKEEQQVIKSKS